MSRIVTSLGQQNPLSRLYNPRDASRVYTPRMNSWVRLYTPLAVNIDGIFTVDVYRRRCPRDCWLACTLDGDAAQSAPQHEPSNIEHHLHVRTALDECRQIC